MGVLPCLPKLQLHFLFFFCSPFTGQCVAPCYWRDAHSVLEPPFYLLRPAKQRATAKWVCRLALARQVKVLRVASSSRTISTSFQEAWLRHRVRAPMRGSRKVGPTNNTGHPTPSVVRWQEKQNRSLAPTMAPEPTSQMQYLFISYLFVSAKRPDENL